VIQDFDFIGLILFSGGLLIFLMGVSWGGSYYPWKSGHVIGTIIVGFFALVAFILYEAYTPLKEPLMPMNLFRSIPWVADILLVAFGASVYFAFAIVWPQMVFALYTSDLTLGGWLCCVSGGGANSGQIVAGLISRKIGKQKYQLIFCTGLTIIFLGVMSILSLSMLSISNCFAHFLSGVTDSIRTSTNTGQLALAQRPITKTPLSPCCSWVPSGMATPIPSVSASPA
jgi:hypothetical protein